MKLLGSCIYLSSLFYLFLNVSHPNHPFGGQRTKTADPVDFFVDPKTQKS